MPVITLPDGAQRQFDTAITPAQIAADIGPGLAKAALAATVDGAAWDLNRPIETDSTIALITAKNTEMALELVRHDCAHIMAEAVLELYPDTQVTIGPAIENGFYYDFHRQTPFSTEDLAAIEQRMHEIVDRDEEITRGVWTRNEALAFYRDRNEPFKVELVESIPAEETVSYYAQGDFIDLCRGPHLTSTSKTGHAFKLMKVAGAYWRGDSTKPMLQRIYGTAWLTEKDLKSYLTMLEEAEKRDHRKLGKQLDFFHLQEEAAGSVFWHPKGWTLYREIEMYMRRRLEHSDYAEVKTPQLVDRSLWEASGHWDKFGDNMFTAETTEDRTLVRVMCRFIVRGLNPIVTCLCGWQNLAPVTAMSLPGRCMVLCGCVHSLRMMRIFSVPKTRLILNLLLFVICFRIFMLISVLQMSG